MPCQWGHVNEVFAHMICCCIQTIAHRQRSYIRQSEISFVELIAISGLLNSLASTTVHSVLLLTHSVEFLSYMCEIDQYRDGGMLMPFLHRYVVRQSDDETPSGRDDAYIAFITRILAEDVVSQRRQHDTSGLPFSVHRPGKLTEISHPMRCTLFATRFGRRKNLGT